MGRNRCERPLGLTPLNRLQHLATSSDSLTLERRATLKLASHCPGRGGAVGVLLRSVLDV